MSHAYATHSSTFKGGTHELIYTDRWGQEVRVGFYLPLEPEPKGRDWFARDWRRLQRLRDRTRPQ